MKAKELRLGDPIYWADSDDIGYYTVKSLQIIDEGDIIIKYNNEYHNTSEIQIKPDCEKPNKVNLSFTKKEAQDYQYRCRQELTERAYKALIGAKQHYQDCIDKLNSPLSDIEFE